MSSEWTFESLREALEQIPQPSEEGVRQTLWIKQRVLGVAISGLGACEIFVAGEKLRAMTLAVRRQLQHDEWSSPDGTMFVANRLVLPNEGHFQAIAALVAVEMLRLGLRDNRRSTQDVFTDVEPIVEMALRGGALADEAVIGLLGELLTLEQFLRGVRDRPELRSAVLDMWRGHQDAVRDFFLGTVSVEVKTTTMASSTHMAHSLAQVEADPTPDHDERTLFLLSVGFAPTMRAGLCVADSVERILDILADPGMDDGLSPLQLRFLGDVGRYGAHWGTGYDHQTMKDWKTYQASYTPTFAPRLYDLCDPEVLLLRREQLKGTFVRPDRVSYSFELPDVINEGNPIRAWQEALRGLARTSLGIG